MNGLGHCVFRFSRGNALKTFNQTLVQELETCVHLLINGKDHDDLPDGLTVAGLIAHLNLPERKIAVERNREVIPKSLDVNFSLD